MNMQSAYRVLIELNRLGVRTICLCPGGRNAPFVRLLSQQNDFEVIGFYDERSAGFFALGRSRRDQEPVAVIVTSGTAVSELLSPVIEAYYCNTPLVIVSADRPKSLRLTGAPQTIDQTNLFGNCCEFRWDLTAGEVFSIRCDKKPIHINLCFDEPLLDSWTEQEPIKRSSSELRMEKQPEPASVHWRQAKNISKPLFVVGGLNGKQKASVEKVLENVHAPIFAESLSGLRASKKLQDKLIKSGDSFVSDLLSSKQVDAVIRIGDVPLGRFWRDMDHFKIPSLSVSDREFAGCKTSDIFYNDLTRLNLEDLGFEPWDWQLIRGRDQSFATSLQKSVAQYPYSEVALLNDVHHLIPAEDAVYLGNSLPIREWDLVDFKHNRLHANRGVNGIDGQLSSAIGLWKKAETLWVILGDLTSLYDFSGFWLSDYLKQHQANINFIIINNQGGQIFSRLFEEELFLNKHTLSFAPLAKMWGWNYQKWTAVSEQPLQNGLQLIELCPDQEQSQLFWQDYDSLWKNSDV